MKEENETENSESARAVVLNRLAICCPRCKSTLGFYTNEIVAYSQYRDWDGKGTDTSEFLSVKGGKIKRCQNCNKNITKYVDEALGGGI